jgi:hypothetical protein
MATWPKFKKGAFQKVGRYSVSLWARRYGFPVIEPTPAQTDLGAHPASSNDWYRLFPGVTRPGRGVGHPPSNAEVKEIVHIYPTPLLGIHGVFYDEFYLPHLKKQELFLVGVQLF